MFVSVCACMCEFQGLKHMKTWTAKRPLRLCQHLSGREGKSLESGGKVIGNVLLLLHALKTSEVNMTRCQYL